MNRLEGQALHAFGQIGCFGEQALAHCGDIEQWQLGRVVRQVPGEQLVFIEGVRCQRPHNRQAAALGREHARYVQKRLGCVLAGRQAQFSGHPVFFVQSEAKLEQPGLRRANQARQCDGGAYIRQRIVGGLMCQAVGGGEVGELEAGADRAGLVRAALVRLGRPDDALRAQRIGHTRHVEQIPAAAIVFPFPGIRVDQIAPQQKSGEFIVEADGVVADTDGAGLREGLFDAGRESMLRHTALQTQLRRDAGDQNRSWIGQVVVGWLAIEHQRLADFVQLGVGAYRRKLRRPVEARINAEGFVVVPEKSVGHKLVVTARVKKRGQAPRRVAQ